LEITIEIKDKMEILQIMQKACSPENDLLSTFALEHGTLRFHTTIKKVGNIYSLTNEILRCYELIKKIN
jgi:hypothetical protein